MTKKIYIKLLVVIQIMVLGVMLISCEKDEKKDETGILLKQGAFVDEKDNYKTFNENDEGVYKEIDTNGKIINNYNGIGIQDDNTEAKKKPKTKVRKMVRQNEK